MGEENGLYENAQITNNNIQYDGLGQFCFIMCLSVHSQHVAVYDKCIVDAIYICQLCIYKIRIGIVTKDCELRNQSKPQLPRVPEQSVVCIYYF